MVDRLVKSIKIGSAMLKIASEFQAR
ncbi:hypothetical protein B4U80_06451 [Leptotrombidium deliense]|uniref:Uncharacterized protein n=1 Tax=Leptotrombidium deliense TaxID=299467 RepID=A0A443SRZ6_9ACAR|nr:hypothetical protein B4U80_06451 [Leptotrombidium deliense]